MFTRKLKVARRDCRGRRTIEVLEDRRVMAGPDDGSLTLSRFESAAELESFLLQDALTRWEGLFGQPGWQWGPWFDGAFFPEGAPPIANDNVAAPPRDHSDTNTQVAGVDEDDIVETDGDFLYILTGQELVIADAWQPSEMRVVSRMEIDGQPIGEFLRGDRLTVLSNEYGGYYGPWLGGPAIDVAFFAPPIGYEFAPPKVVVTVFDVTDREHPQIIQRTKLDGSYIDSRAVGDSAYVITSDQFGLPQPELICEENPEEVPPGGDVKPDIDVGFFPPFGQSCVYETRDAYLERVTGKILELGLPQYESLNSVDQVIKSGWISQPTDTYKPITKEHWNLISVSVFDMAGNEPGAVSSTSVPTTSTSTVYGSTDSLYLTNPDWGSSWGQSEATSILKFDITDNNRKVDLAAVGQVPGRVLNSFSIDEHDDAQGTEHLRIATTIGWGAESDNRVFVLRQNGENLETVGRTQRLAPGEQIFSVRFSGDTGYVVTFRQVDPLFTIDLTEPTNPVVKGDLHIPGFSNYLQPIDDRFLLGLGRNADPSTGRVQELQVSLFDVSDLGAPRLADRFSFDVPGWAWSEAISDHHAVSYFPAQQVLTIPVANDGWVWVDRDGDGGSDVQTYRPRTDLYVFRVDMPSDASPDTKAAIRLLGTVSDDAQIRRSVRIEQFLYSISDNSVSVHEILNPEVQVAELHFGQEDVGVPVFTASRENDIVQAAIQTPEKTAPQVIDMLVGGTGWHQDFVNHLEAQRFAGDGTAVQSALSYSGVDQIKVKFSEDVIVGSGDLVVRGADGTTYQMGGFTYEADKATAVWTLASPIQTDSVSIRLGSISDWAGQALDGNGNGQPGGRFQASYTVVPGDVDRDGRVDLADLASAKAHAISSLGDANYVFSHDIDGNGRIDTEDFTAIMSNIGSTRPGFVAPLLGDSNRDGRFDSSDLVQVMQAGKYRNDQYASWEDGDWNRDGLFDESDFVRAFQEGRYESGPQASVSAVDVAFELLARAIHDGDEYELLR